MKIILTGATGLIGSRFEKLMLERHEIVPLSISSGVDITDPSSVDDFIYGNKAYAIIHLAGLTDVDGCEEDKKEDLKNLGVNESNVVSLDVTNIKSEDWIGRKTAFAVNTIGTKNLYNSAQKNGIKFVYISTDFVFEGKGEYYEDSGPNPINWYGMTKYLGEKAIDATHDLIVRLAFPYGYRSNLKKDFVWKLHDLLQNNREVSLLSDQIITPSFIDDIINGLIYLLEMKERGIYHLTGSQSLTPKEIGQKICKTFGYSTIINDIQLSVLYKGKAPRPFQSIMRNDKIVNLGFVPKTFDQGLALLKNI